MSSGGGELGETGSSEDPEKPGSANGSLRDMIRTGASFSGHERHCAFLNTGDGRFADVSFTSGFDFPDDGRGLALVDWDQDGDLDLWLANRNAPQVRFLLNDGPPEHHWVALHLAGKSCNRDAIGARVEVELAGREQAIARTLYAGNGFLSQSSKWLLFGLGGETAIERVVVRWPGGEAEAFEGVAADGRYRLEQGRGVAERAPAPERALALRPSRFEGLAPSDKAECFLQRPLPLPALEYAGPKGERRGLFGPRPRPVVVNLWASWCAPCLKELRGWTARADDLERAGVDVLAVSIESVGADGEAGARAAREMARELGLPFDLGLASPAMLDLLQLAMDELFPRSVPLALPTTLLIDTNGELSAVYKGAVEVDRLLADVARLDLGPVRRRVESQLFPGRWNGPPVERRLVSFVRALAKDGYVDDAAAYADAYGERLGKSASRAQVDLELGLHYWNAGRREAAVETFRKALAERPRFARAHNALAFALEQLGRLDEAAEHHRLATQGGGRRRGQSADE